MKSYDLIIIGGGPGGYVAAIRAGQAGLKTALIEKHKMGGCCLNWGCIPSRRLMESAKLFARVRDQAAAFGVEGIDSTQLTFNWKRAVQEKDKIVLKLVKGVEFLMKKNGVEVISGEAAISGRNQVTVGAENYGFSQLIIATGSRPDRSRFAANLPAELVVEIDDFYSRPEIPQRIVVVGGGTVACEVGNMLRLLGKEVTIVASQSRLLTALDRSLSTFLADKFKKLGIKVLLDSPPPTIGQGGVTIGSETIACDVVLNCATRAAIVPTMTGMELERTVQGFIKTFAHKSTSVNGVYAIGDVTGTHYAQHASAHGAMAVAHIAGMPFTIDESKIPINIYTDPELAAVGFTEEELTARSIPFVKGEFPLSVNSKAIVEGATEGFTKILADEKYGEILGAHIVASKATDLISELAFGMNLEATLEDLYHVVHPHPTVSETVMEAGYKALGKPLHL